LRGLDVASLLTEHHQLFQKQAHHCILGDAGAGKECTVAMSSFFQEDVKARTDNGAPMEKVLGGVLGQPAQPTDVSTSTGRSLRWGESGLSRRKALNVDLGEPTWRHGFEWHRQIAGWLPE